jgi:glycerol-3-phosphate acyltransferase PlsY
MIIVAFVLSLVVSYFLGGINAGIIITKIVAKKDIRTMGSGNAGSTNVLRVLGVKPALLTLLCDFLKGVVSVALAMLWFKIFAPDYNTSFGLYTAALGCVYGHMYPAVFKLRGGKGVITFAGAVVMLSPWVTLCCLVVFVAVTAISKHVSLGSIVSVFLFPVGVCVSAIITKDFVLDTIFKLVIAIMMSFLVIFKHAPNIVRLFKKTESKISFKNKPEIQVLAEKEEAENQKLEADILAARKLGIKLEFVEKPKTSTEAPAVENLEADQTENSADAVEAGLANENPSQEGDKIPESKEV